MRANIKRALVGRLSHRERGIAAVLAALGLCTFPASLLFLPYLGLSLAFGWKTVLPLSLYLSVKQGPAALLMGATCAFLVEGFREVHRRESQLARHQQDLLKTLVHELRNPLFAAKGTIDNLSARIHELEPSEMELQLAMASSAMQSINQEVDDLTQLLRLESGRLVARQEWVRLAEVFKQLERRFPPQNLGSHSLVIQGEEVKAYCDSLLILQALDKLVGNAVIHSDGGTIRVEAMETPGGLRIVVEDEGPGIPPNRRQEVFERFKPMAPNSIGFGLGLYLARQYVLAQDGELTLEESENGCRFQIWLPGDRDENQDRYS